MPATGSQPQSNQDYINNLEAWLWAHTERPCNCPCHSSSFGADDDEGSFHTERNCRPCNGTGTITDPRYQAAREKLSHAMSIRDIVWRFRGAELPDSMWLGLLEDVAAILWPFGSDLPRQLVFYSAYTPKMHRFSWDNEVQLLGKALLEALNATS